MSLGDRGGPMVGALLAGGGSRRMGRDKAGAELLDRRTLADAVLCALGACCDELVVLGHGRGVGHEELERIADLRPGAGPLAGLEALLRARDADSLLVAPCDMPLLTAELLSRLPAPPRGGVAVFGHPSGEVEPFPMRLCRHGLGALETRLDGGRRDVRGFVADLPRALIALRPEEIGLLININRPEELEAVRHELERVRLPRPGTPPRRA